MSTRIFSFASTVALILVGAFAANAAAGGKTTYPSKVRILAYVPGFTPTTDRIEGQVTSAKAKCIDKRKVELYRETGADDERIGSAKSTDEGFWFVDTPRQGPGTFYAKVKKRDIGTNKHKRICESAKSKPLVVPF
jgi:hypothetical protein